MLSEAKRGMSPTTMVMRVNPSLRIAQTWAYFQNKIF